MSRWLRSAALAGALAGCEPSAQVPAPVPPPVVAVPVESAAPADAQPVAPCTRTPQAWLLLIEATSDMATGLAVGRQFARAFIAELHDGDLAQLNVFNDVGVMEASAWGDAAAATAFLDQVLETYPPAARHKDIAGIVTRATSDAFADLAARESKPPARTLVIMTDGNGALGTEAQAAELGHRLAAEGTHVIVVWIARPLPEELFARARSYAESLAPAPHGAFVAAARDTPPDEIVTLAAQAAITARGCPTAN